MTTATQNKPGNTAQEDYRYGIQQRYLGNFDSHGEWLGGRLQELIAEYCRQGASDKASASALLDAQFGYRPRISGERTFPNIIEASTLNQRISSLKNGSFTHTRQLKFYYHFLRAFLQAETETALPNSIG